MRYWSRGSIQSARTMALAALLSILASAAAQAQSRDTPFQFGILGDIPYTKVQEQEYRNVLEAINRSDLAFVVHIGDFEQDARRYDPALHSMPCVDENFKSILDSFQRSKHPFIFTPGDNDWTDCHFLKAPKVDPLEALAKIRSMFFPEGRSLGQRTIAVTSQASDSRYAKFRENLRWSMGGVTFATVHIVGSNDNLGRTTEMDAEHAERKAANIAWLKQAFTRAKADVSRGLVIITQANLIFEKHWTGDKLRLFTTYAGVSPSSSPLPTGHAAEEKCRCSQCRPTARWTGQLCGVATLRFGPPLPPVNADVRPRYDTRRRINRRIPVPLLAHRWVGGRLRSASGHDRRPGHLSCACVHRKAEVATQGAGIQSS